jgi:hypothetical protein
MDRATAGGRPAARAGVVPLATRCSRGFLISFSFPQCGLESAIMPFNNVLELCQEQGKEGLWAESVVFAKARIKEVWTTRCPLRLGGLGMSRRTVVLAHGENEAVHVKASRGQNNVPTARRRHARRRLPRRVEGTSIGASPCHASFIYDTRGERDAIWLTAAMGMRGRGERHGIDLRV